MITTLGRELIRQKLPEGYKDWADKTLDKKNIVELTTKLALDDRDKYVDVLQDLNAIAERTVSTYGKDAALSFMGTDPGKPVRQLNAQLRAIVDKVLDDPNLTEKQKEQKILDLGYKYTQKVEDVVYNDQNDRHTALASQINSGSRGNKTQLMQLMFGNMMMKDAMNRDIPYLMMDPYVYGISPMAFWVSASSGRKGMYDVQAATGQSGYLSKQVTNVTHDVTIEKDDCGTTDTGMAFKAADTQNLGRVLLKPFHKHPAGSIVTPEMIAEADDDEEMLLRTPLTCKCRHGICAKCNGLAETGRFPDIGSYVALNAARTFTEKVTQSAISCLHPDTLVRMADWSIKPIKDICVGDRVIGVDLHGRGRPVTVTATFNHGMMPMCIFQYRKGFKTSRSVTLMATTEHKALQCTHKSMCRGERFNNIPRILPLGERCASINMVPIQSMEPWEGEHHVEALFLGMMAGDGCYTRGVKLLPHFSCADPTLIEDTRNYMSSIGLSFKFHKGSSCYWRVIQAQPTNIPGIQTRKGLARQYLDAAGMTDKYAHEKEFPHGYENWDSASMSAYISGLLITDGSLYRATGSHEPRVAFGSTSEKLVKSLCDMLTKHCGVNSPQIHTHNNDGWHKRTMFYVVFGRKDDVRKLLKFVRLYGVKEPLRITFLKELDAWYEHAREAEKMLQWRRMSVVPAGQFEAFDIEVDHPDHLFLLANGLVVSNSKHKGGVGGKKTIDPDGEDQPTGFAGMERMFLSPANFPGGAVLSPVDGLVSNIRPAPQGGNYITVGSQTMYALPERTVTVHKGDKVTAGDALTNGVPSPLEVVSYKGLGQGRKYYTYKLADIFKKAGFGVDRYNLETFTRAMLNKVRITDENGYKDYLPGDVVSYSEIAADYQPRENAVDLAPDKALNQYLEKPVLHYNIGTRITPDVASSLHKYGFDKVTVSPDPPPFKAEFMRPMTALQNDSHWIPRMAGERLYDALFDAARKGITDPYDSPSYVDKIVATPFK